MVSTEQIENWNIRHAQLMLILIVLVLLTDRIELLSLGAIISFSSLIHRCSKSLGKMEPPGGYANWVTGFRLVLILIGSFLFGVVSKDTILIIMFTTILLDVIDGFLARKYDHVSKFGNYFDMEVDAFFVLLMCFYYYQYEGIGWWILIPSAMRYLYKVFTTLILKPDFIEKEKSYATIIAGVFFFTLCAGLKMEREMLYYSLLVSSALIILSFGISWIECIRFNNKS